MAKLTRMSSRVGTHCKPWGFRMVWQAPELAYPSSWPSLWVPSEGKGMDFESLGECMGDEAWGVKPLKQRVLWVGSKEEECWGKTRFVKLQGCQP